MAKNMTTIRTEGQGEQNILALLPAQLEDSRDELIKAIPPTFANRLTPTRVARLVMTMVKTNPDLQKCTLQTLLAGVFQSAQRGLELDSTLGHAYLVPFYNGKKGCYEAVFMVGYKGLVAEAYNSAKIAMHPMLVYEKDAYTYMEGVPATLQHCPSPDADRGKVIAAYNIATFPDGRQVWHWMWRAELDKAKMSSQTGRKNFGPWKDWPEAMMLKTVLARHCKYLPLGGLERDVAQTEIIEAGQPVDIDIEGILPPKVLDAANAASPPGPQTISSIAPPPDAQPQEPDQPPLSAPPQDSQPQQDSVSEGDTKGDAKKPAGRPPRKAAQAAPGPTGKGVTQRCETPPEKPPEDLPDLPGDTKPPRTDMF